VTRFFFEEGAVRTHVTPRWRRVASTPSPRRLMDAGVVAIAFFGVRGHSFEDNEYRAAHVALAIVSALKRYDLRAKCGVTVGVGFCGLVGAPNRSVPASRATPVRLTMTWVALFPMSS
jgi:hypothetical protein